jgi:hypothetical protein
VHSVAGLGRTTLLRVQEWRCRLGDKACMVDGVTSSGWGRWGHVMASTVVGNELRGDSKMARRLWGGHDDGTGSREVDDSVAP